MRALAVALVAIVTGGCGPADAAPPWAGGGGGAAYAPTVDSTLAQCQALTPAEGAICYPTDAQHIAMVCRAAGTWTYLMGESGEITVPPTASWSWDNQVSATITSANGVLTLFSPADAGLSIHSYVRTAPATPWTLRAVMQGWGGATRTLGLTLRESGTGELYRFGISLAGEGMSVYHNTSPTAGSSLLASGYGVYASQGVTFAPYITDNGTNLVFGHTMPSGVDVVVYTVGRTAHMAAGPDQFGLNVTTTTDDGALDLYSWVVQ